MGLNFKYITCMCGACVIQLTKIDDEVYMQFFESGRMSDNALTFKQRLRWIWRIIKTGKPFEDGIILDKAQSKQLINVLTDYQDEKTST